ncbi:MAG: serine hydrolase domain-containing protein [Myxococcota bacterium]
MTRVVLVVGAVLLVACATRLEEPASPDGGSRPRSTSSSGATAASSSSGVTSSSSSGGAGSFASSSSSAASSSSASAAAVSSSSSVASASSSSGGAPSCQATDADFTWVEQHFRSLLDDNNIPGGLLAVVCGTRTLAVGHGVTRQGTSNAVTSTTRFQLASTTKTLTALTAWRMHQQGEVDLAAPASELVPYMNTQSPYARSFTVEELLSHSAGWTTDDVGTSLDLKTHMQQNASMQLWAEPGAVHVYSNPGYALAGLALQEAAGTPFADLVESRVFAPAGMTHATMHGASMTSGTYAYGHAVSWPPTGTYGPTDSYYSDPWYGPMGGAWLSAQDFVALINVFLANGSPLLDTSSFTSLTTPRTRTDYPGMPYAQGLYVAEGSSRRLWHGGSVGGFLSRFEALPDEGFGLAWVVNSDAVYLSELADEAITRFTSWSYGDCPDCYPQPGDWQLHVGTYEDAINLGTVVVSGNASSLTASFQDQGITRAMTPDPYGGRDQYVVDYPPAGGEMSVMFWREGNNPATHIVSLWGVAARVP